MGLAHGCTVPRFSRKPDLHSFLESAKAEVESSPEIHSPSCAFSRRTCRGHCSCGSERPTVSGCLPEVTFEQVQTSVTLYLDEGDPYIHKGTLCLS